MELQGETGKFTPPHIDWNQGRSPDSKFVEGKNLRGFILFYATKGTHICYQ